ncbi:tyrosinase [Phlegmacium glaucopus]|nr:tyrosinase [Phlegmacium glaucopus]
MLWFPSFSVALLWVVFNLNGVLAYYSPSTDPSTYPCKNLLQRREWRTLDATEKNDYINAVKCLQSRPAFEPHSMSGVQTRFDDFQASHIQLADRVHLTGQFLPWHRYFLRIYENALRTECGYKGATPYWDWTQDAEESKSLLDSPVFDPITGFGGTGVPGTYILPEDPDGTSKFFDRASFVGCVQDGPFASQVVRLGPGKLITDHCLVRGVDDAYKTFLTSRSVALTMKFPSFFDFHVDLEGQPLTPTHRIHDGGHVATGGEMSNFYSSPGDPIFYLHHANLDRIWWNWQQMLPSRLYEISGRSTPDPPYQNVTLEFELEMGNLAPNVTIRNVMDIHSDSNCYTYV